MSLFPKGRQAARAVSIQAVVAAKKRDFATADLALKRLDTEFPEHPLRVITTQQLAELADAREDWPTAARLYTALIPLNEDSDNQPYSIRGLAWAQLKQKQSAEAAVSYARVLKDFATHKLAAECAYYRADALREVGDVEGAIAAFDGLLKQVSSDKPAEANVEQQTPWLYSYRAGLQAARLQRKAKRTVEADAAYDELVKRFPKPQRLDQLLDEWALLNYDAARYERADDIFRRLIQAVPNSELADNARLSLAESDLIADKLEPARKAFEELFASDKSDPEVKERSLYQLVVLAVAGQFLEDQISRCCLQALATGYDTHLLCDAVAALDGSMFQTHLARLIQAGVVPSSLTQLTSFLIAEEKDAEVVASLKQHIKISI